jgi:hypothetical protein
MKHKSLIIVSLIALCMISCTPQQRLARLCNRHPYLCNTDTTYVDTLISSRVVFDSTFTLSSRDTFLYEKMGVTTKIIRNHDTFSVHTHKTDTSYIVQQQRTIMVDSGSKWHKYLAYAFLILLGLYFSQKLFDYLGNKK